MITIRITGKVVRGDGRGRLLGFPTANLSIHMSTQLPRAGVYSAWAFIEGISYMAAVHVGPRPTFSDPKFGIEAHIINFVSRSLYGKKMTLFIVKKIRSVKKFDNEKQLIEAITLDCTKTIEFLASMGDSEEFISLGE